MKELIKIRILLFARARDLAGAEALEIALAPATSVRELRQLLAHTHPALGSLLEKAAFAVNGEFAEDRAIIPAQAEVALLPPVSGG